MVLERRAGVQWDEQGEPDHPDAMGIFGDVEHPPLPRWR